ncbi:hypothetical protein, partial [Streptomyces flavofungini]|uniref:hypothetical protein n=1 Tax=Streptomyces flavofungini TaxID=68200 RepID=UPI0034DEA662
MKGTETRTLNRGDALDAAEDLVKRHGPRAVVTLTVLPPAALLLTVLTVLAAAALLVVALVAAAVARTVRT